MGRGHKITSIGRLFVLASRVRRLNRECYGGFLSPGKLKWCETEID